MKVFIGWSGGISHRVAEALRDWLPNVIQAIEPFVSSEDIETGARWETDIARELEASHFGIIALTPENVDTPWLNFEAGALSKSLETSRVAPLLVGLKPRDIRGPLVQFQSVGTTEQDMLRLVTAINGTVEEHGVPDDRLPEIFNVWWPKLEEKLSELSAEAQLERESRPSQPEVSDTAILEEVLETVRAQQRLLLPPLLEFLVASYIAST